MELALGLGVAGLICGGLVTALFCHWSRRRSGLGKMLLASVPNPRQAIDGQGRVLFANPAFRSAYGETDRPTPDLLLSEVGDDEEVRGLTHRLEADAKQGVPGQAE
ncbi:MAG TPA: hypothetical protein VKN76_13500, partial [Kiloniellaceae bacterium]|nr:hypothetical protein [Kiloniellaceae bacterium]